MKLRRILKPIAAAALAAGLFSITAAPVVASPSADTGWGFKTADTGWGRK